MAKAGQVDITHITSPMSPFQCFAGQLTDLGEGGVAGQVVNGQGLREHGLIL